MKIAIICDLHLSDCCPSAQYSFLVDAVNRMKQDRISTVLTLGDITSFGEPLAFQKYRNLLSGFEHILLVGNSDVRNPETQEQICSHVNTYRLDCAGRTLLAINTPYAHIEAADREQIESLQDGDILAMHHGIRGLDEDSRNFLADISSKRSLTIINGHHHRFIDETCNQCRLITFRAADPDKSIGNYPCITYVDITADNITLEERMFPLPNSVMTDINQYFGISCVDNFKDVSYALEHNVYAVELRTNGHDWTPDMALLPLLQKWRSQGKRYLSVHMPNLYWKDDQIIGIEQWEQAADYARKIGADGLTVHLPTVEKSIMQVGSPAWNAFLTLYSQTVAAMPVSMHIGFENFHLSPDATDSPDRKFGCIPEEVGGWIDAVNAELGQEHRIGHTLDVGHARNNAFLSQKYPISRWYESMGKRVSAYHIHQVIPSEYGLSNHHPIENWFGPVISYASFFQCWRDGIINHKPVFLEVRGWENYHKSIDSFQKTFF